MQILSHSILRLLQRPNLAASPAPMPRLFSTSRPLLSSMASSTSRWWRLPLMAAPDPPVRRVSRFPQRSRSMACGSGVTSKEESAKPDRRPPVPSVKDINLGNHSQRMISIKNSDTIYGFGHPANIEADGRNTSVDVIYGDEEARRTSVEVTDGEIMVSDDRRNLSGAEEIPRYSVDRVVPLNILPYSSHRDGSVYWDTDEWKKDYHIVDRSETWLEAMMLSDPTDCIIYDGTCVLHRPRQMLQIFSLKLAKIPVDAGSVELYGYIAARDNLDPLLNYVVNIGRDDPILVEQGSLIHMAPKRGIKLNGTTLIEYDMKIKTGEHEKDDLQLIDGISVIDSMNTENCNVFTCRIIGDCGAIDISASCVDTAVEATIEVVISEVQGSFAMSLGCFTSEIDEEIQLFDDTVVEARGLGRSVVAVALGDPMDLKFKVGSEHIGSSEYFCSFKAHNHGSVSELIKTDFASISVRVSWSVLPCRFTNVFEALRRGVAPDPLHNA